MCGLTGGLNIGIVPSCTILCFFVISHKFLCEQVKDPNILFVAFQSLNDYFIP